MPYNTRRKSLSLPSLGILIPLTQAEKIAAQVAARTASHAKPNQALSAPENRAFYRPDLRSKRLKRSHHRSDTISVSPSSISPPTCPRLSENTPPPSPSPTDHTKLQITSSSLADCIPSDEEFIDAVLVQLRSAVNKPQPTKELSAALAQRFTYINQSANPCSIVASRLAAYMRQAYWTEAVPCPISKLIAGNPRRTYYYTNATSKDCSQVDRATRFQLESCRPASPPDSDEESDLERRRAMSPSPEVDLGLSSLDDVADDNLRSDSPVNSVPSAFVANTHQMGVALLERDEREFTQTADVLQKRKLGSTHLHELPRMGDHEDWTSQDASRGPLKFTHTYNVTVHMPSPLGLSTKSDFLRYTRRDYHNHNWTRMDRVTEWDQSPENIELDEIDVLFAAS